VHLARVVWYWQSKTDVVGAKPVLMPLCLRLTWNGPNPNAVFRLERLATNHLRHYTAHDALGIKLSNVVEYYIVSSRRIYPASSDDIWNVWNLQQHLYECWKSQLLQDSSSCKKLNDRSSLNDKRPIQIR